MSTPEPVRVLAPAKINLALEVIGRRPDGYHDIDTVMTTLDLADRVTLSVRDPGAGLEVMLSGDYAAGIDAADDLSGRGARALAEAAGREPDLRIEVEKRIPSPAGLGGGASDAAAVLRGLNVLWALDWPAERLAEVGAGVGSDVPFFVYGGTARCTGRGEVVEPLKDLRPLRLLVLLPPVPGGPAKTARRYAALHQHDFSDGHRSQLLAQRIARNAPPPTSDLVNVFEAVIERTEPELVAHYARYTGSWAPRLHLCGAGPAVFLLVSENAKSSELRRDFARLGATVFEARTWPRAEARMVRGAAAGHAT
ncbi:MAG: 4-(cytidine 5'-diphospho)-2-C-methyl-D-erythritol kinase [Dehalococcoidia bacterium]|nr:4-(cytidine 5'-diphospho)-2-C-methyl-D-erythritol kinase [Dehalococcoidia bacterium]